MSGLAARRLNPAIWNSGLFDQVYNFWFAGVSATAHAPPSDAQLRWFGNGSPEEKLNFDKQCDSQFHHALDDIAPDRFPLPSFVSFEVDRQNARLISAPFRALDSFKNPSVDERAKASLGLVLLVDQLSRNVFRNHQALIYDHYDRISRAFVESMFTKQDMSQDQPDVADIYGLQNDSEVLQPAIRRTWFYLPLMHSEDILAHDQATKAVTDLRDAAKSKGDQQGAQWFQNFLNFEEKHRAILDQFNRYPHRDEHLGRQPTEEERKYLEHGGERFGA